MTRMNMYKDFDGKRYKLTAWHLTSKIAADEYAKLRRKQGLLVRILHVGRFYHVYTKQRGTGMMQAYHGEG